MTTIQQILDKNICTPQYCYSKTFIKIKSKTFIMKIEQGATKTHTFLSLYLT